MTAVDEMLCVEGGTCEPNGPAKAVTAWGESLNIIREALFEKGNGCQPLPLVKMLHIHFSSPTHLLAKGFRLCFWG